MPALLFNISAVAAPISHAGPSRRGWVGPPSQRGTMDIIWSCASTLFICMWTMLHLNLPAPNDGYMTTVWRKARWVLLGILAPELPMLFAFAQWASAKRSVEDMKSLGHDKWTIVHAFYADAGGSVLHPLDSEPFPITAKQVKYLVEQDYMDLPAITELEIWDKSKADRLAKFIACFQTAWLATQIISRAIQDLPVTPLELLTMALAFCSLTTLYFWLHKPLNIKSPTTINLDMSIAEVLIRAGDAAKEPFRDTPLDFVEDKVYMSSKWSNVALRWMQRRGLTTRPLQRIPNDRDWKPSNFRQNMTLALPVVVFATIHLLGWNLSFPTRGELILWRANSVFMWVELAIYGTSEVVGFWKAGYGKTSLELLDGYKQKWPLSLLFHVPATLYFSTRICLLMEALFSLRSLPAGAFVTVQWSEMLPHI